jgi:hypothetical protein
MGLKNKLEVPLLPLGHSHPLQTILLKDLAMGVAGKPSEDKTLRLFLKNMKGLSQS